MSKVIAWIFGTICGLIVVLAVGYLTITWIGGWGFVRHMTTYCTDYVKVKTIEPKHYDDGKYSDEMYIVTWEDGVIEGSAQGDINPYRCTKQTKAPSTEAQPSWKPVSSYGTVEWEQ